LLDGLILSGGGFDVDPKLYGETTVHEAVTTKPHRTQFEWDLFTRLHEQNKPILGICGGMQLINVALGGSLHQHIPDSCPSDLIHSQDHDRHEPAHDVKIVENTNLFTILEGKETTSVNSVHHQAVKDVAPSLKVNAHATDGLIEGIENPNHKFCIGIQWHPEFHVSPQDRAIFEAFIETAKRS
jgi:putative glutamine amidotransferase